MAQSYERREPTICEEDYLRKVASFEPQNPGDEFVKLEASQRVKEIDETGLTSYTFVANLLTGSRNH